MRLEVPIRIESEANVRQHWAARHKRLKAQQNAVHWSMIANIGRCGYREKPAPPCTILLTRIGPRKLDTDNLVVGFKAVRDEIARWLGVDDGDDRVTWQYAQERGRPKEYAIRIEVS
jgi:hypothetical protein